MHNLMHNFQVFKRSPTPGFQSRLRSDTDKCVRNLRWSLLKEIGCLKIEHFLREGEANRGEGTEANSGPAGQILRDIRNSFTSPLRTMQILWYTACKVFEWGGTICHVCTHVWPPQELTVIRGWWRKIEKNRGWRQQVKKRDVDSPSSR